MKNLFLIFIALGLTACNLEPASETVGISYPETATVEHVDNYHGTEIADPYRWLENDVREDSEVSGWVAAQNEVTFAYLATIPEREIIGKRMKELWDFERYSLPRKQGGRYFYSYNDGLQNQSVIHTQTSLDAEPDCPCQYLPAHLRCFQF